MPLLARNDATMLIAWLCSQVVCLLIFNSFEVYTIIPHRPIRFKLRVNLEIMNAAYIPKFNILCAIK